MANFINFSILGLHAYGVNSSSGVFAGENLQYGWRTSSKANTGMGKITGDYNVVSGGSQRIDDPDYLDTYVQKPNPFLHVTPPNPIHHALSMQHKRAVQSRNDKRNRAWD